MRIAFDLRRIESAGVGRYMRCFVDAVLHEAPEYEYLFIMAPDTEHHLRPHDRAKIVSTKAKYYSFAEQFELPRILRRHRVDVLHALHFVVPLAKYCPTVVTIHDAIHLVYPQDLNSRLGRLYSRWMMAAATRVSDRILTVSEYSKSDLCRYLAVKPEKITVSYPAPDENFGIVQDQDRLRQMKEKLNVPDEYILYTGIYRERKNHAALLRALALLLDSGVQIHLVIAGGLGEGEHKIRALAGELGITKNVILTGFVPDQEMPSLYSAARAYVCPSLYEGFGLTLVEAMACGVPVVSHNETSLPEICGQAALCVNARDPGELAQAIRKVLEDQDLRENLIKLGYENISRFSYRVAARDALQIYRALASTKAKGERRQVPLED